MPRVRIRIGLDNRTAAWAIRGVVSLLETSFLDERSPAKTNTSATSQPLGCLTPVTQGSQPFPQP